MADEVLRIIARVEAEEDVANLTKLLEQQENALKGLSRTSATYAVDARNMATAIQVTQQQLQSAESRLRAAGGGMKNLGQAALEGSRALEDLQYGIHGVINNLPPLIQSLGGPAGLAAGISVAAVAATQLYRHWDDVLSLFGQGKILTEAEQLAALAEVTGLAASEQERLNRARAGEKGAKDLGEKPIETEEEGEREKQLRGLIADRGGSEAMAARMAAEADRRGEAIDTGDLDERTRDALKRAQDRLAAAERGGRVDPKTGMPTGDPDPEAIEAARRELEMARKRARAVQARREIADALASSEGQDALERRLGQLGLSRDAEGIGAAAAARARETDMLNEEGRKNEQGVREQLEQRAKDRAASAASNSTNVREILEKDIGDAGEVARFNRRPGDTEEDLAGARADDIAEALGKARDAFDGMRLSEEDYLAVVERGYAALDQAQDQERKLAEAREKAAEASRNAAEAAALEAEQKAKLRQYDQRVDRRADLYGQAFGGAIARAQYDAASRGEDQKATDARLKGQLMARMRNIAPGMREGVADEILKRSRMQAEDYAVQRGFQKDMMGAALGGMAVAGDQRTLIGQMNRQRALAMGRANGIDVNAYGSAMEAAAPTEKQLKAAQTMEAAVKEFKDVIRNVEVRL